MGWFVQVVGTGLVLLAIADIYLTVLYPRGGRGVVSVPLNFNCQKSCGISKIADMMNGKQGLDFSDEV